MKSHVFLAPLTEMEGDRVDAPDWLALLLP